MILCREAYEVHKKVIEWGMDFSKTGIPERAVGVGRGTARLTRYVMQSLHVWNMVSFTLSLEAGMIFWRTDLIYFALSVVPGWRRFRLRKNVNQSRFPPTLGPRSTRKIFVAGLLAPLISLLSN
jgi:hypothetical protein